MVFSLLLLLGNLKFSLDPVIWITTGCNLCGSCTHPSDFRSSKNHQCRLTIVVSWRRCGRSREARRRVRSIHHKKRVSECRHSRSLTVIAWLRPQSPQNDSHHQNIHLQAIHPWDKSRLPVHLRNSSVEFTCATEITTPTKRQMFTWNVKKATNLASPSWCPEITYGWWEMRQHNGRRGRGRQEEDSLTVGQSILNRTSTITTIWKRRMKQTNTMY